MAPDPWPRWIPGTSRVLAVVAHPDDESFGLGAVLAALAARGAETSVLCLTHGEASTLHGVDGDLGVVRAREFGEAADALGIGRRELLDHPDGGLDRVPLAELTDRVDAMATEVDADTLVVFDLGGVTGHPDHRRATAAALAVAAARGLAVVAWALPVAVAATLNAEFGTAFVGRDTAELSFRIPVDRTRQRRAMERHRSQFLVNPVLARRLELLGDVEWLRDLRPAPRRGRPRRSGSPRPGRRSRLARSR